MPLTTLKHLIATVIAGLSLQLVHASDPTPASAKTSEKTESPSRSSFWPKSFGDGPVISISVITDMTAAGRKLIPPTKDKPTYCFVYSKGYHEEGYGAADETSVAKDNFKKLVQKILAANGYLPSDKEHLATQVLFLVWGVHVKLQKSDVETGLGGDDDLGHRNLLSRAALVGGDAFEKDLAKALHQQGGGGGPIASILDPVNRFTNRDELTRDLMTQIMDDCYYVAISAYNGASLASGKKELLWRTRMSTSARGISLVESTPALVASGGPFFGHEMAQASIITKHLTHNGRVELGPLELKEYLDKPSEPTAPPAKK